MFLLESWFGQEGTSTAPLVKGPAALALGRVSGDCMEVDNLPARFCCCQPEVPPRHPSEGRLWSSAAKVEMQKVFTEDALARSPASTVALRSQRLADGRSRRGKEDDGLPLPAPGSEGQPPMTARGGGGGGRRGGSKGPRSGRGSPRRRSNASPTPREGTHRSPPRAALHTQESRELRPEQVIKNGARYTGEWLGDVMDGEGTARFPDGSVYKGQYVMGKAEGHGTFETADGSTYEGQWVKDQASGHGVFRSKSGRTYVGQWAKDTQHGQGTETDEGTKYTGSFQNGVKHGQGRFLWVDGSVYDGQFADNCIHGWGIYIWNNGRRYEGQWNKEKMHGKGRYTFPSGAVYDGDYLDDQKHGWGTFKWADGHIYTGQWEHGQQHGEGTMTRADGSVRRGVWQHGRRVGSEPQGAALGDSDGNQTTTFTAGCSERKQVGPSPRTPFDDEMVTPRPLEQQLRMSSPGKMSSPAKASSPTPHLEVEARLRVQEAASRVRLAHLKPAKDATGSRTSSRGSTHRGNEFAKIVEEVEETDEANSVGV